MFLFVEGVKVERKKKDVLNKVNWIEKEMKECYRWSSATGQGIKDYQGNESFEEALTNKFPHFHELDPFFRDRSGMNPKCTSDELSVDGLSFGEAEVSFSFISTFSCICF